METTKLYNGEVEISFDPDKHKYFWGDKEIDGVTSVLKVIAKPQLIPWAVKKDLEYAHDTILERQPESREDFDKIFEEAKGYHDRVKEGAGERGTFVHKLIERFAKGLDTDVEILDNFKFNLFRKFVEETNVSFKESERPVFSKKHLYCGTTDGIVEWNGKLYILDIKTNSIKPYRKTGIYLNYWLQTSAYQKAYEEETGVTINGRVIVRLGDDGIEVAVSRGRKPLRDDFSAFGGALSLHRRTIEYGANRG